MIENALLYTGLTVGGLILWPLIADTIKKNLEAIFAWTFLAVLLLLILPARGTEILEEFKELPQALYRMVLNHS